MRRRMRDTAVVKQVDVVSAPVCLHDVRTVDQLRVLMDGVERKGAIVRVRARLPADEVARAPTPADVRAALLSAGATAVHVTIDPLPDVRQERVEGVAALASPRDRVVRFMDARQVPEDVRVQVTRILDEEGL